jgi:hypothetical protein
MNAVCRIVARGLIAAGGVALTLGAVRVSAESSAPAAEPTPYRPLPPNGAAYVMDIPPVGADGVRRTLNMGLDEDETIWHVRSGWNVAALDCIGGQYRPVLTGYAAFLKTYARELAAVNRRIEAKYRNSAARDARNTRVYNYFATPAAIGSMCPVALAVANEWLKAPSRNLSTFARATLPRYDAVYLDFFNAYDRYRADSAAWDAKYGALYGSTQPGYVAVHGGSR